MLIDREVLLKTFRQESEELLAEIERLALDLDERPEDGKLVEELFRCAHTLKGGASCVGFEHVMSQAHELEGLFEAVTTHRRAVDRELTSLALDAVDLLRKGLRGSDEAESAPVLGVEELKARIRAWLESAPASGPERSGWTAAEKPVANVPHTLRVDVERLDGLLNLVGEVAIAEGRLRSVASAELQETSAWQSFQGLFRTLEESVMRLRLVPLGPTLDRFRRAVRDLSEGAGKQAELVTEGGDVEVDVTLAEALRDPLMHMIRNAIDHGLEAPARRRELGKDPVGRITLSARHDGNYVVVDVADDGAGIDTARLVERAEELGLPAAEGDATALNELAFAPGLSTAESVTNLSGRGIGMDVVRRDIEALRGSVTLASVPGAGLTVSIRVPLTVAMIQGFGVRVGQETYILPVDSIRECIDVDQERRMRSEVGGVFELRGKPLPYVDLAQQFATRREPGARPSIVVLEHGALRAGLEVDALVGEVQTVIRPLGPLFASLKYVAGSAVLADGRVALVLDVGRLMRSVA